MYWEYKVTYLNAPEYLELCGSKTFASDCVLQLTELHPRNVP